MAPRPALLLVAALGALGALGACGPTSPGGDAGDGVPDASDQPHTLIGIDVSPVNPLVELDLNTPGSQPFTVTGRFRDGVPEDLTSQVTWTVANPAVGSMTGATLSIPAFASVSVEVSRVTATYGEHRGEAQITVVAYRRSGPQQDFFFILPYEEPSGPATRPLDFSTAVPSLDAFFLMDTTGSMLGEIVNLQNALTTTVVPGIRAAVPDSQFGVGAFEDFPIDPYGSAPASSECTGAEPVNDQPFELKRAITSDIASVATGVASLRTATAPIGCGDDWPESGIEALYQVATGEGLSSPSPTHVPPNTSGVGGVGYRGDAMPVVVAITDAVTHGLGEVDDCPEDGTTPNYAGAVAAVAHTRAQAKTALGAICARVVGVASIISGVSLGCTGQPYLEDFATATGARVPPSAWDVPARPAGCAAGRCCTDIGGAGRPPDADGLCPLVFRTNDQGAGLGAHIVTGIQMLTRFAAFDVTSEREGVTTDIAGNPLPAPRTTADFIKLVTPTGFVLPPPPPNVPSPTFDATAFYGVTPGTQVSFDVQAFNDFVVQTADAQIFRAVIRVLAGGCTPLDQREVLILVPPIPIVVD
jgi:hypothetical protein